MDWIASLEKLAPTIASCLGTPVAGMAVQALESALGVTGSDNIQQVIQDGKLNGDQVAAVQQAEIALKAKAQEMSLDFAKLAVDDRSSARGMQVATRSLIVPIMASFVTIGFFSLMGLLAFVSIPDSTKAIFYSLTGSLGAAWLSIINFYFGSSSSSQSKDATIHTMAADK